MFTLNGQALSKRPDLQERFLRIFYARSSAYATSVLDAGDRLLVLSRVQLGHAALEHRKLVCVRPLYLDADGVRAASVRVSFPCAERVRAALRFHHARDSS